jgi:hypothetical protein
MAGLAGTMRRREPFGFSRGIIMRATSGVGLGVLALLLVLGSGMGRLVGQQGDAKPPENPNVVDLVRELEKVRAEAQKARQEAEELRKIATQERARAIQAIQEATDQAHAAKKAQVEALERAEAARREVERALGEADEQLKAARYGALIEQARAERSRKAGADKGGQPADVKAALAELEKEKAAILQKYREQRAVLAKQLQGLEAQEKATLAQVEARRGEMLGRFKEKARTAPAPEGAEGKLDKILDRLDAIEKRLDQIEKGKPKGDKKSKKSG